MKSLGIGILIMLLLIAGCTRQEKMEIESQILEAKEYGMPFTNGIKVWVATSSMQEAEAVAKDVVDKYGGGYDEVTVFLYPPGIDAGTDLAKHSFTWSNDAGMKQDF